MKNLLTYAPGPTMVRENVRMTRLSESINPDIDAAFVEDYRQICDKWVRLVGGVGTGYILSGEAILGLEAACASLTEDGDRVLVLDNGIYGAGFAGFVDMYGGQAVCYHSDYDKGIDVNDLRCYLEKDHHFKYATLVHCDTPTGVLNDIVELSSLLNEFGILSVVDAVSAVGGVPISMQEGKIDVLLGGPQKAISAPTGLTLVALSKTALKTIENRQTPVKGFYANLGIWRNYYIDKYFPYTLPASDIYALGVALDNIFEEGMSQVFARHNKHAKAVRTALIEAGLQLFLKADFSATVTAFYVPKNILATALTSYINKHHQILLATSLGAYQDSVIRIGHMGENAQSMYLIVVLQALEEALQNFGFECQTDLAKAYLNALKSDQ